VQLIHHNYKRVLYPLLTGRFIDPLLACIELYHDQLMASSFTLLQHTSGVCLPRLILDFGTSHIKDGKTLLLTSMSE